MLVCVDVVAQRVRTTWTKRSRGGPGAAARNRVPIAFPLPAGVELHDVQVDESAGFEPRFAGRPLTELDDVRLREADGGLLVLVTPSLWGMPRRNRPRSPVRLEPGEWLRWQVNLRFGATYSSGREWSYQLETLNLAYGGRPDFTGKPTRSVTELGDLR